MSIIIRKVTLLSNLVAKSHDRFKQGLEFRLRWPFLKHLGSYLGLDYRFLGFAGVDFRGLCCLGV